MLPHEYPFRFADRLEGSRVGVRLPANGAWLRGAEAMPRALAIEILAQAAILLLPHLGGVGRGLLAGVDDVEIAAAAGPGDTLAAQIEVEASYGSVVRVRGLLCAESGETIARATLTLARGTA